jgi:hypothetical protein
MYKLVKIIVNCLWTYTAVEFPNCLFTCDSIKSNIVVNLIIIIIIIYVSTVGGFAVVDV